LGRLDLGDRGGLDLEGRRHRVGHVGGGERDLAGTGFEAAGNQRLVGGRAEVVAELTESGVAQQAA
jgi:hypothetical protein